MSKFLYFILGLLLFLTFSCKPATESLPAATSAITATETAAETIAKVDTSQLRYIMGKFLPEKDSLFVAIPLEHADREGMYMRQEAFTAFVKMKEAAAKEGIHFVIRSAARNFDYQKGIWERKWTGETKLSSGEDASTAFADAKVRAEQILKYSSMPGTSRHHWGTDIDLNNFNNSWFEKGEGLKLFTWLEMNAHEYGYCRPYTTKDSDRPDGYNEEKWHWSYTPLSNELTNIAEKALTDSMIVGFMGSEVAEDLDVVRKYVLGINHGCRH